MSIVYSLVFNGEVVYYGVTDDIKQRLKGHTEKKFDHYEVVYRGSRVDCLEVEKNMISTFNPVYNTAHRSDVTEKQKKIKINPLMLSKMVEGKTELDALMVIINKMGPSNKIQLNCLLKERIEQVTGKGRRTTQRAIKSLIESGAIESESGEAKGTCTVSKLVASIH